jgi:hypothetical protein
MSGQKITSFARQLFLGRPGVVSMLTLWCVAVGCVFLPLRHRHSPKYMLPGLIVAMLFAFAQPSLLLDFALIFLITSAVMGPATFLISTDRQISLWRGIACVALAIVVLAFVRFLHGTAYSFAWLTAPVLLLCPPVGLLLLIEPVLKLRAWYSGACSATMFAAAWMVWMLRAYFYAK